jgi:hypothetical protein
MSCINLKLYLWWNVVWRTTKGGCCIPIADSFFYHPQIYQFHMTISVQCHIIELQKKYVNIAITHACSMKWQGHNYDPMP